MLENETLNTHLNSNNNCIHDIFSKKMKNCVKKIG